MHLKCLFQFDEDVDEIVDQIMEEIVERGPVVPPTGPVKEPTVAQKKLACKFRKSCYETGTKPTIDSGLVKFFARLVPKWPSEEPVVVEKHDISTPYNPEADLVDQKMRCKYRTSCYIERGIPIDEKAEAKKKAVISQKSVPLKKGKKKTLKEIAAHTIKKMQEAEQRAAERPVIKIVERRLNAAEEKRNEKLNCKYRKSCYETGEKPVIESAWALPLPMKIFSTESAEKVAKEINYEELEELEKKVYCKYRKSCYETGVKPEIEPEIFIRTFADLTTLHEQVETRKLTLKEKCKYRKSCYETGIVPEINPKLEAAIHKDVSSVIPTNAADLRLLCKYRKSCYEEVYNSATVDTIKFIRKRRQIEKEVRRRKARRAKLHRRLRGELKLGSYRSHRRIADKKHADAEDQPVLEEPFFRSIQEEVVEEEQQVESTPSKNSKARKSKQSKKAAAKEEVVIEPIVEEAAIEAEDEEPPQVKKLRKVKKVKPEEPRVEKPVTGARLKKKREPEQKPEEEKEKLKKKKKEPEPKPDEEEKRDEEPLKLKKKKKEPEAEPEPKQGEEEHEEKAVPQNSKPITKRFDKAAEAMKKMIDDMHHQQEIQQHKEFCKYRKSCYESGKRPEIDQSIHHLLEKFSEHVDRELSKEQEVVRPKTEADKKLECKYRKSCYETGILPDIKAYLEPSEDKPIVFKAGVSKQLQCKYRKSCYVEAGLSTPQDVGDTEQKRTPGAKKISEHVKVSSDAWKDDAAGDRKLLRPEQAVAAGAAVRSSDKEKVDGECKPGQKSCYSSAEPRELNEDEAGTMARTGLNRYRETGWCNQYYYSCREILGLPPKERAPIGPNGKRLCRKKKPLDSFS
ncbi:unnamed protein product [Heligmosomoides polygyrus]|uniref:Titin n=1 Tax=Heligmosomoides polygyrus TaxID=6339 RepID=A0A183FEC2_HELPZ|nr:unnamed protein product [Heligmosomoides polygyrus]